MTAEQLEKRFIPMSETMFYILSSLSEERHGYGIMQHVDRLTNGRIILGAGTVYQTLSKLEKEGLIVVTSETERKKLYIITPIGKEILTIEASRICELYKVAKELI